MLCQQSELFDLGKHITCFDDITFNRKLLEMEISYSKIEYPSSPFTEKAISFLITEVRRHGIYSSCYQIEPKWGGSNRRNALLSKPSVNETIQMIVYDASMLTGMVEGLSSISCHVACISNSCNIFLKISIKHTVLYWYQYGTIQPVYLLTIYTNHHLKHIMRNNNYIGIVSWTASN